MSWNADPSTLGLANESFGLANQLIRLVHKVICPGEAARTGVVLLGS